MVASLAEGGNNAIQARIRQISGAGLFHDQWSPHSAAGTGSDSHSGMPEASR
jgi:hypothetical protein